MFFNNNTIRVYIFNEFNFYKKKFKKVYIRIICCASNVVAIDIIDKKTKCRVLDVTYVGANFTCQ